jgi:hypothetical protein
VGSSHHRKRSASPSHRGRFMERMHWTTLDSKQPLQPSALGHPINNNNNCSLDHDEWNTTRLWDDEDDGTLLKPISMLDARDCEILLGAQQKQADRQEIAREQDVLQTARIKLQEKERDMDIVHLQKRGKGLLRFFGVS